MAAIQQAREAADARRVKQERVLSEHEPRNQDTDEWCDRDDRTRARYRTNFRAARLSDHRQILGRLAARNHQRHSRFFESGGAEAGTGVHRFRSQGLSGSSAKSLHLAAREKGLYLHWQMAPEIPAWVAGDPHRVRQILVNLLNNAIKFTAKGGVSVEVVLESEDTSSVVLHFTVGDTGMGVPRDKQKAIFEAFVQGDNSATRKFGGTGLGLAISSRLAQMMDGDLWVNSEPGAGSDFHFRIRLQRAAEQKGDA